MDLLIRRFQRARIITLLLGCFVCVAISAQAQMWPVTVTSGGRFLRGTGTNQNYMSVVIPLSGQKGVAMPRMGYEVTGTNFFPFNTTNLPICYHYNATNTAPQPNYTGRIPFQFQMAAFGSRAGGSPLYYYQPYMFGIYAGVPFNSSNSIFIRVINKADYSIVGSIPIPTPDRGVTQTNEWASFLTNGYSTTVQGYGLTTTLFIDSAKTVWGIDYYGTYRLTHVAEPTATNYIYQIEVSGYTPQGYMCIDYPSRLYTLEFENRPAWRSQFVDQPQFQGAPLPPSYDGKSLDELLTNAPLVTYAVSLPLSPGSYTNLDDSPELRRHPILDQFVSDMRNDPIALTAFVHNEIELSDALAMNDNGPLSDISLNLGGVNRNALTTFLARRGSPVEQCALLVYLLRQAGYPAVFVFPPEDGMKFLDTRLSKMLGLQIRGAQDSYDGSAYTSNRLIAVNYPWVATYVSNQWVHVFPWIKDTQIVEGLNLWDYMPTNYNNSFKWVLGYLKGDPALLSLSEENSVEAIFPAFVKQTLLQNHPGISVDDIGVHVTKRPRSFLQWSDFPRPTVVTNVSYAIESLSDTSITNVARNLTNIFDTISVRVFCQNATNKYVKTGDMRMADVLNRRLLVRTEKITTSTHRIILSLAAFRTNVTGIGAFSNDPSLLKQQSVTNSLLTSTNSILVIETTYKRHRALTNFVGASYLGVYETTNVIVNQGQINKGDLAAICFDVGGTSPQMLAVHAQDYWNMEQQVQANLSLTNTLSPDVYQGTAAFLMGMSYGQKRHKFRQLDQQLQKAAIINSYSVILSELYASRTNGQLPSGNIDLRIPGFDILDDEYLLVGNTSIHADSGNDPFVQRSDFDFLDFANASAQEHQVINGYYKQSDAISTVRLLQLAQSRATNGNPGILLLNRNNYLAYGSSNYSGVLLKNADTNVWHDLTNSFGTSGNSNFIQYVLTPGTVTNNTGSYKGMGSYKIDAAVGFGAFISANMLNGGSGESLPAGTLSSGNIINLQLMVDPNGNYYLVYTPSSSSSPTLAPDATPTFDSPSVVNDANNGAYVTTDFQDTAGTVIGNQVNDGSSLTYGDLVNYLTSSGDIPQTYDANAGSLSADPVNVVTGEFYIDSIDLALHGPMPLEIRRNYSSQNLAPNQFGYGWKLDYMPYLTHSSTSNVFYAAEVDGSVIAYEHSATNVNLWVPTALRNPQMTTFSVYGIGSAANRFSGRIVRQADATGDFYILYSPNGSVRTFQWRTFAGAVTSTRAYLTKWQDAQGNFFTFEYGTNSANADFGQVRRIQSSNGNFLGFYFDSYARIIEAYTGDGRRTYYDYDQFGDLATVTLPDSTQISYDYQHRTQSVTNGSVVTQEPYSTHLIVSEDKPDGRTIQSQYDSNRRVTNQLSTVGADLNPVRTATFIYSNNFSITNSITNTITGTTIVQDVNGNPTRYDYSSSLITNIVDQLNHQIQQYWYADDATAPGYPRSLWKEKDRRGLWTELQYDSSGNVTNTIVTGDLTGDGTSKQAITSAVFDTNNLPLQITDPATNTVSFVYSPLYPFLRQQVIKSSHGVAISTNFMTYYNVTNVLTNGTRVVTNQAFGLLQKQIRAYGSADAATNEFAYDGRGWPVQTTTHTATTDPDIVVSFIYNDRGELIQQQDAANRSLRFDYDGLGRLKSKEHYDENGANIQWDYSYYNDNGELVWSDGPRFNPEDYIWRDYDGDGRLTQEIHWRSRASANASGMEAETGDALYAITFYNYDTFGNLTNVVYPLQNYTVMAYDAVGQMLQKRFYGADGKLLKTLGYGYEAGGKVAFATNALGGVTTNLYTTTGLPKARMNPDGTTEQWRYNLDGRLASEILPNGTYWQITYDDINRRVTRALMNCEISASETKEFDRRGNLLRLTDVDGNVFTNSYDGLDRIKVAAGPAAVSGVSDQQRTTYVYDNSGKVLIVVNGLAERTITTSDAAQRPISIEIRDGNSNLVRKTSYTYSLDHNSVTTTEGTSNTITTATFTDTYGKTALVQRFPAVGVTAFTRNCYDWNENLLSTADGIAQGSAVTTNTLTAFTYDGLNRVSSQIRNGTETITFGYNAADGLTNRSMPGPLSWIATYDNANRMNHEELRGYNLLANRVFNYTYYSSGANIGLPYTVTDPRSILTTFTYDGLRRLKTKNTTGSQQEQNVSTSYGYDNNSRIISISQSTAGYPSTTIQRTRDGYGQIVDETVSINGQINREIIQHWNAAGKRDQMNGEPVYQQGLGIGRTFNYGYRADGVLTNASAASTNCAFVYGDNGLLLSRSNPFRTESISLRDGIGHIQSRTLSIGGVSQMAEALSWRADGKMTNYIAVEPGFTDSRSYAYNYSQVNRLKTETLSLNTNESPATFTYDYDFGANGGPGVRTDNTLSGGSYTNHWYVSSAPDALRRVIYEFENNLGRRFAVGTATNAGWVTISVDGRESKNVDYNPVTGRWRALLDLMGGLNQPTHSLVARAYHPLGVVSGFAINTNFVDPLDYSANAYDQFGNNTSRIINADNHFFSVVRSQTLTWDGWNRLVKIVERDDVNDGYNWTAIYDALGRRIRTTYTPVVNNAPSNSLTLCIDSWFDPQVPFLEIGTAVNGQRTWKVYGPDVSGSYGGAQGVGGLEATIREFDGRSFGLLNDYFGNGIAVISNGAAVFGTTRVGAWGSIAGCPPPQLNRITSVAESSVYYGTRIDPSGLYWFGHRYYDANAGKFISPDPLGHSASIGLYDFCGGDPINFFDPDGRCRIPLQGLDRLLSPYNFPGTPGTGYSLDRFNFIEGDDPSQYDSFAQNFAKNVANGTSLYPYGNLGPWEIQQAVNRGYVQEWDQPLLYNQDINGTAVAMTGSQAMQQAFLTLTFGAYGEAISAAAPGISAISQTDGYAAPGGALRFSQTTASPWFSADGTFAGQTISDVAAQLRAGTLSAADVPVGVVTIDGNTLIVNTRSSLALSQANIPQSSWNLIDLTGDADTVNNILARLAKPSNKLTTAGTPVIRITGSGSGASTYVGGGTIPQP